MADAPKFDFKKLWEGDTEEWVRVHDEFAGDVKRYAVYLLRGDLAADDVLQDTFVKAMESFRKLKEPREIESPKAWLCTITLNLCRDIGRERTRRHAQHEDVVAEAARRGAENPAFLNDELKQLLRKCINELPENYRTVFVYVCEKNLTYRQVASLIGVAFSTVRHRYHKACQILAARPELRPYFRE